jgi:hypothetical protein
VDQFSQRCWCGESDEQGRGGYDTYVLPFAFERELITLVVVRIFLVAGPNRPPARPRLYETPSEVGGAEGDPFGRMVHAAQERGCVLPMQPL